MKLYPILRSSSQSRDCEPQYPSLTSMTRDRDKGSPGSPLTRRPLPEVPSTVSPHQRSLISDIYRWGICHQDVLKYRNIDELTSNIQDSLVASRVRLATARQARAQWRGPGLGPGSPCQSRAQDRGHRGSSPGLSHRWDRNKETDKYTV